MNAQYFFQLFLTAFPFCAAFCVIAAVCELAWRAMEQRRRIHKLARVVRDRGRRVLLQEDGKPLMYLDTE